MMMQTSTTTNNTILIRVLHASTGVCYPITLHYNELTWVATSIDQSCRVCCKIVSWTTDTFETRVLLSGTKGHSIDTLDVANINNGVFQRGYSLSKFMSQKNDWFDAFACPNSSPSILVRFLLILCLSFDSVRLEVRWIWANQSNSQDTMGVVLVDSHTIELVLLSLLN